MMIEEIDYKSLIGYEWDEDVEYERREQENEVTNEEYLIRYASEKEFRQHILSMINNLLSSINQIRCIDTTYKECIYYTGEN